MKKAMSILLVAVMMICMLPLSTQISAANLTLTELKAKFPQNAYWNHIANSTHYYSGGYVDIGTCNNPDGYTWSPCYGNHQYVNAPAGQYDCNSFDGGIQCYGFAMKLGYDAYGTLPSTWQTSYTTAGVKPGDIIRYTDNYTIGDGHSIFVIGVSGNVVTVGECNYGTSYSCCRINWTRQLNLSTINLKWRKVAPYTLPVAPSADPLPAVNTDENIIPGKYTLTNVGSGKMMNYGWGLSGDPIILYVKDDSPEQTFNIVYKGSGLYAFQILHSNGGCVKFSSASVGGSIVRCTCGTNETAHQFYLTPIGDGTYVIRPASNKDLVVGSDNNGKHPALKLYTYSKSNNLLRWKLTPLETPVAVSSVKLSSTSERLAIGEAKQMTATIAPSNATNKKLTWSSSNTDIVKVSESGELTAVSVGDATVTVKTADGGHTATVAVSVYCKHPNSNYKTVVEATCKDEGRKQQICALCGITLAVESIPKLSTHSFGKWVTVNDPAVEGVEIKERVCSVCGKKESQTTGFYDLPKGSWFTEACMWCSDKGYMSGTGTGVFSPDSVLTRAQFVQILAKVAGIDLGNVEYKAKFTDVPDGQWYSKAVTWAVDFGVTGGMGDGKFAPNAQVTRAQLAAFLRTYAQKKGVSAFDKADIAGYADYPAVPAWASDALAWAVKAGLISGTDATHLSPNGVATRAQAALIIKNLCEKVLK